MPLLSLIKNIGKFFGVKLGRTVASFDNKLAQYEINNEDYRIGGCKIFFIKLNVSLSLKRALPILEGYENAIKLSTRKNAIFFAVENGDLHIQIDNTVFKINDEEELFILCEVFIEGSYNLLLPNNKRSVLIDIGMNVGVTSIFYGRQKGVEKIFSFEPFEPTFNMALENIKLNTEIAYKFYPNNFGLAKSESNLQTPFSLKQKGRMGLNGLPAKSTMIKDNVEFQTIYLKPIKDEFEKIKKEVKGYYVVCKMDCEGVEYELIDSLYENNLLSLPDVYFIEWHYKSPDKIVTKLMENNFTVINTTFRELHSGMIYAIKN